MPDQPVNQYGPFTSALTGPLTPQQQRQDEQPVGYGGTGASIAQFANAFLHGAQQGQRTKYERSEQQKQEQDRNFDALHTHIQNDPGMSDSSKKEAEQVYLQQRFGRTNEALQGVDKSLKDHPIVNFMKSITGAAIGPGKNDAHKNIDINSLMSIAANPNNRINPEQIGQDTATKLAAIASQIKNGVPAVEGRPATPGSPAQDAVPAQEAVPGTPGAQPGDGGDTGNPGEGYVAGTPAVAAQAASAAIPATPEVKAVAAIPARALTKEAMLEHGDYRAAVKQMEDQGIDPWSNKITAPFLNALPTQAQLPKPYGTPQPGPGPKNPDGTWVNGETHLFQDMYDPIAGVMLPRQDMGPLSAKPTSTAPPGMSKNWVLRPGSDTPEQAYINTHNPNGFFDENNKPLPQGTTAVITPTEGNGSYRGFSAMAKSQLHAERITNPTPTQILDRVGKLEEENMGIRLGRVKQQGAMDAELSGISMGNGFTTPAPKNQTTTPPAAATTPVTRTLTPPSISGGTSKTAAPPVADALGGNRQAPSTITSQEEDAATAYMGSIAGTNPKGGGKGMAVKVDRGRKYLIERTGLSPSDLESKAADYQATRKALTQAVEVSGAFGRVQETLKEHGKVLEDAATAYGPGDTPIANRTVQWIQSNAGAHPELTKYLIAINAVQREYGRLVAGGVQSKAMLPISASRQGETIIRADAPMKDVIAAVQQLGIEANTEQKAFGNQQKTLTDRMESNPISKAFRPSNNGITLTITGPTGTVSTKKFSSQKEADDFKAGTPKGYSVK